MIRLSNVKILLQNVPSDFKPFLEKLTGLKIESFRIVKKSVDARKKNQLSLVCAFDVSFAIPDTRAMKESKFKDQILLEEKRSCPRLTWLKPDAPRPIVVGTGPAGLMAGLALAESGARPLLIERGRPVARRHKDVELFWSRGTLDVNSNVQFGEGGAGTFSDGKLNTGIKKDALTQKVLDSFVEAGAPEEILYAGKPHVGTDKLGLMVSNLRSKIESLGGEYRFETRLTDIIVKNGKLTAIQTENQSGEQDEIPCSDLILAIGHSARDTFEMLYNRGVTIIQKPFAVGARIEHRQSFINKAQYGMERPTALLGAADYKLAVHLDNGRGAYSFCMCPGGYVVAAASENGRVVTNGMSCFSRDGVNANSAMLVDVRPDDFGSDHPLAGVEFQRRIEENAFKAGGANYKAPVQRVSDFLRDRETKSFGAVEPTYRPGTTFSDLRAVLPPFVVETLKSGLLKMDAKIKGFSVNDALLTGAETRSSSPVRLVRDPQTLQSVSVAGLYPCGEGAGYAGGIMSAAADGLKCAYRILGGLPDDDPNNKDRT